MEKDELEKGLRSLFTEIGAERIPGKVYVFSFSEEKQWIAYTSKDYKLPSSFIFSEGHFCFYFPDGNPTDRTDACVHITTYVSDESMNSVEDFWKGNVPYTSKSGLVATLLTDTFRPTPELQKGFDYNVKLSDKKQFTIRGHEKNMEAQYRTIQESVKNLQSLCEKSRTSITSFKNTFSSHYKDIILTVKNMDEMFGKITNSDMQKCLEQIEEVQKSAEDLARAWENGSDEFKLRAALGENVTLMQQNLNSFGHLDIVKLGIDLEEQHVEKIIKTVADFKSGFREANNCVETFRNVGHTLQNNIVDRKINSAKGNIARVYLEEQLMLNEEMPYYCTQLLLSSPFIGGKMNRPGKLLDQAVSDFKQMMKLIPDEMKKMNMVWAFLNTIYQHLMCHEIYPVPLSMNSLSGYKLKLEQQAVELFKQWFNEIVSMKTAISMQSYTTKHLQSAIIHAQVLEQFHVASDGTTVSKNGIHFRFQLLEDNEKMLKHDEQLYLVITSSIISLCQSKQTNSMDFISLLRFAAKHWNVRRWFVPFDRENKQQTCLKSLASFCNTTQSTIAKAEKQCDEKPELAENLNQLNTKITAMKTTLDETEGKFQDMFSELRRTQQEAAADIDHVPALLKNQAVSDTKTLPKLTIKKVNEFVEAVRNTTGPIAEIKEKIETVVQPYVGEDEKDYKTTVKDLVELLKCFRSTRKQNSKNITDFITRFGKSDASTGDTNRSLKDAKYAIEKVKGKLNSTKGMGNYEVAVCKDALNKLEEVETSLNPDYLKSVLHRLQLIVGELREETNPPELIEFLTKLKEKPPFAQPAKRERNDMEETLGQLVDTVLNTLDGKYYKADLSAVDLVSLNKTIAKLLKHLDPKDTQLQLRSSWTKFMLPKFEQAYEQLRKIDFERYMTKLNDAGKHFSLHLVKRDWMNVWMHYTPFYCWNGGNINEDPHYTANDTHLPCE